MSIDKDTLLRLMDSPAPSGLFGKGDNLFELTKALAEPALSREVASISMKNAQNKRLSAVISPLMGETAAAVDMSGLTGHFL